jgi:hypothetical protein
MCREEALRVARRLESPHGSLTLARPCRPLRTNVVLHQRMSLVQAAVDKPERVE